MEIHLEKSEIIFFSFAVILVLSLAFLWSALAVDTSKPWHPLSQIQIDQNLNLGDYNLSANQINADQIYEGGQTLSQKYLSKSGGTISGNLNVGNLTVNGYTVTKYLKVTGDGGNEYYMHTWVTDWPETDWLNPNDNHTYIYVKFNPNKNWGEIGTWNSTDPNAKPPLTIFGNPVRINGGNVYYDCEWKTKTDSDTDCDDGETHTLTIECPNGKIPISGGWRTSGWYVEIKRSSPDLQNPNKWIFKIYQKNNDQGKCSATVYALCCKT